MRCAPSGATTDGSVIWSLLVTDCTKHGSSFVCAVSRCFFRGIAGISDPQVAFLEFARLSLVSIRDATDAFPNPKLGSGPLALTGLVIRNKANWETVTNENGVDIP